MHKPTFFIRAGWDDEAKVYYAESDIEGLHIEAKTIDAFETVMMDVVGELIAANHETRRGGRKIPPKLT